MRNAEIIRLGRALGGLDMVQGPGGNVSLKDGDNVTIKASGVRLRDLDREGALTTVPLGLGRAVLDGAPGADALVAALAPRPSLEVTLHTVGPRVVAHTHSLGALLVACASDERAPDLQGAALVLVVGYARPGPALGRLVRDAVADLRGPCVAILQSHGLVVFADEVDEAISLTRTFDRLCRDRFGDPESLDDRVARYWSAPLRTLPGGLLQEVPFAPGGPARVLFPDAAVFCPWIGFDDIADANRIASALAAVGRPFVVSDGARRAVVAPNRRGLEFAVETLAAHDMVDAALRRRGRARYIDPGEAAEVAGMPSELFRLQRCEGP